MHSPSECLLRPRAGALDRQHFLTCATRPSSDRLQRKPCHAGRGGAGLGGLACAALPAGALSGRCRYWLPLPLLVAGAAWPARQLSVGSPQGYVPPEVSSGELRFQPDESMLGDCAVMEDVPSKPVVRGAGGAAATASAAAGETTAVEAMTPLQRSREAGRDAVRFNLVYEKTAGVPKYERATDNLLADVARPRRGHATPAPPTPGEVNGGAAAGLPFRRLRDAQRCFNCGSYAHAFRDCWHELRQDVVERNRR